ncbi:MAG: hypothetical protein IPF73_14810 [Betaproteobacteria bacterium]|nr:hypothetical protein [Betaproteobacteria bacterium]
MNQVLLALRAETVALRTITWAGCRRCRQSGLRVDHRHEDAALMQATTRMLIARIDYAALPGGTVPVPDQ